MNLDTIIVIGADTNDFIELKTSNQYSYVNSHIAVPFHTSTNSWRTRALEAILETGKLPIDTHEEWHLKRPTALARLMALRITEAAETDSLPVPFVVPTLDSGIQLEWTSEEREFEVRIDPDGSMICLKIERGELIGDAEVSNLADVVAALRWLFKSD